MKAIVFSLVILLFGSCRSNIESKNTDEVAIDPIIEDSLKKVSIFNDAIASIKQVNENKFATLDEFKKWASISRLAINTSIDSIVEAGNKLQKDLASAQNKRLPDLRLLYASNLSDDLWKSDIEVRSSGKRNTTITFIGGIFASNSNIADFESSLKHTLHDLRFKKTRYEWYEGADATSFEFISVDPDTELYPKY